MTELSTPRNYLGIHMVAVAASCRSCDRVVDLDLKALIDAGHGGTALVQKNPPSSVGFLLLSM